MSYTPKDMLEYVISHELEGDFVVAMSQHKGNYSIGEIVDKEFVEMEDGFHFISKGYQIDLLVTDEEILTAVMNKLYVSAFISRKEDLYQIHFLTHQYPEVMKPKFEDEIAHEVVHYMILKTIIALRLDTKEKIRKYI